ncbi:hypothetical protein AB0D08_23275 [Kitasatospora sp. NPDC048540]|uniref:hypothetical protein n=1 Tax=unclassified Kitasatospora TaxID=2633591 RepID=UPI00053A8AB1|nr:hypothetical protein [Kitasatospora sp. MBT63]
MRILHAAPALAVCALLTGALTACTGGSDAKAPAASSAAASSASPSATEADPKAALLASAAVMKQAGSAKLTVTGGRAALDNVGRGAGAMVWNGSPALQLDGTDGPDSAKFRYATDVIYLDVPAADRAHFDNKTFMSFDRKALAAKVPGSDIFDSLPPMMITLDPTLVLTVAANSGLPSSRGHETLNGIESVHYRSTVTAAALADAAPGLDPDTKAKTLATLVKDGDQVTFDFWVDAKGVLIRQKESDATKPSGATVVTYTDLGAGTVEVPPAADVADVAALLNG